MLTPPLAGERHYGIARKVRETLASYEELKDVIAMLGMEELSKADRLVVERARRLERYLTQPFTVTERFTSLTGRQVVLEDSIEGCERILADEFLDYSESDLFMIGTIAEADEKRARRQRAGG